MNIRMNKGVVGVDVGIAIIIFIMFVTVITMLFYNSLMSTIATERKAIATDIAIKVIENIEVMDYNSFLTKTNEKLTENIEIPDGYNAQVSVSSAQEKDLLREITVTITYNFKDNEEKVEMKALKSYI